MTLKERPVLGVWAPAGTERETGVAGDKPSLHIPVARQALLQTSDLPPFSQSGQIQNLELQKSFPVLPKDSGPHLKSGFNINNQEL